MSLSGPHDRFNFVLFVKTYTDRTHEHIFIVELMWIKLCDTHNTQ